MTCSRVLPNMGNAMFFLAIHFPSAWFSTLPGGGCMYVQGSKIWLGWGGVWPMGSEVNKSFSAGSAAVFYWT